MRFVHTADWQLGMTRHFLEGEAQPRYSAARRDAVAGLGALAGEVGAEFIVVSGDVFEDNQLAPRVVSQSLEAMRAIGIPVYLLPGNHDPLDAASVYTSALFIAECPDNVTVLNRAGIHEVRPGVQIVAAPWRSKRPTTDLVADVLADLPADGVTRILVAHGGVDTLDPDPTRPSLIRLAAVRAALDAGTIHYVALGDKHSRTEVGDTGRVWYSGSPEVTNYDDIEADPGHVLIVDVDEADPARALSVQARHVGRWRFTTLRREVNDSRDIADLDLNLDLLADKDRTVVRLALTGTLTVTDRAALDACLDKYARLFAWLGLWERHSQLAVVPADGEFADLGIGGFAASAVDELVTTARSGDGESALDAQGALALLLRLTAAGSGAA
jgi:DNA repair exonuclease SbcCD nuclease subunit